MNSAVDIRQIINLISCLDQEEKVRIIESVARMLADTRYEQNSQNMPKISTLKGLGAEIWHKINIDDYVQNERKWK
jgi:ribosomal protein L18E